MAADWPLLTGGRYSEVVVRTGLTVHVFMKCVAQFTLLAILKYQTFVIRFIMSW
jgi:hypothetical protein